VVRDKNGEIYTVRYDAINAMLLNEFLKEHKRVEKQQETIGQLKADALKQETTITELQLMTIQQRNAMEVLTVEFQEQAAQIQKVNARIEISESARSPAERTGGTRRAPQIVVNP
jgi:hypothetical protein